MNSPMHRLAALLLGLTMAMRAWAVEPFVIDDIRVEGLQRIALGTVLSYLPVNVGDTFEEARAPDHHHRQ
jgi:outer membrane protein insertion porin family